MNARKSRFGNGGCGFLVATCVASCCFLAINTKLVQILFAWLAPLGPEFLSRPRWAQLVLFVGPVLLLVCEWWLADQIVDRLTREEKV
jgi:uncharacterized membrane protein YhdT